MRNHPTFEPPDVVDGRYQPPILGCELHNHGARAGGLAGCGLTEPALDVMDPDASVADPKRWAILAVLCLSLLIVGIDGTIVNVALPSLVRELGATSSQLQWIVDAYTIVFASFLLVAGSTGDRLGRKGCLIFGLVVFGVGSFVCSQVNDATPLIFVRGVQGFGAAFIMPATLSIL